MTAMNKLANTFRNQGKLEEAVLIKRDMLGEEHLDTITAMNNLTATLQAQGKLDEAT
jgi:Tetratricopeptide repeat